MIESVKCSVCSEEFDLPEILDVHLKGHLQAEEWCRRFLMTKKPSKKKSAKPIVPPRPKNNDSEIPDLVPITAVEDQASVLSRVLATKGLAPSQLSAIAVQPVRIAKMPRLSEPFEPLEPEDHQLKLMECQNKRKADKRKSMGLPPLKPYYCKDFDTAECFFRYSQTISSHKLTVCSARFTGLRCGATLSRNIRTRSSNCPMTTTVIRVHAAERFSSQTDCKNTCSPPNTNSNTRIQARSTTTRTR